MRVFNDLSAGRSTEEAAGIREFGAPSDFGSPLANFRRRMRGSMRRAATPLPDRTAGTRCSEPSETCPPPGERPALDLEAACPPARRDLLRRLERRSTHRCSPADRRGLSRDGVTFLGNLMRLGLGEETLLALDLFGEAVFRVALRHARPGVLHPRMWKYWHLRLHGEPPRRPPPTVIAEMKAAEVLPPDAPEAPARPWPPLPTGPKRGYRECLPACD